MELFARISKAIIHKLLVLSFLTILAFVSLMTLLRFLSRLCLVSLLSLMTKDKNTNTWNWSLKFRQFLQFILIYSHFSFPKHRLSYFSTEWLSINVEGNLHPEIVNWLNFSTQIDCRESCHSPNFQPYSLPWLKSNVNHLHVYCPCKACLFLQWYCLRFAFFRNSDVKNCQ